MIWKQKAESAALAWCAADLDGCLVPIGDLFGNSQAQPAAAFVRLRALLVEAVEDVG